MSENPLQTIERLDPELFRLVEETRKLALDDGALSRRFKLLIALALDAAAGTADGVRSLASAAMQAGATREEIAETLRVAQYISGVGSTYTAARGLRNIL